jgi:Tfp pilus assembly PilM family ATPase
MSNRRTLEVSMSQLELIVEARLRVKEEQSNGSATWNDLPSEARRDVIERLAEMLRAKLERSLAGEASDD